MDDKRKRLIAKIKIAQQQLGLDDAVYRTMLVRVTGKNSCTKLSAAELQRVAAEMDRLGFRHKGGIRPNRRRSADPMMRKIGALLADMHLHWAYAHALAKRMYSVDRVEWLDDEHMRGVIAALVKKQQKENGNGA
ncbi:gp16 family protein [Neisseria sp. S1]|uniref:gp16 family protein n=1 Tax=Neisseria sp. S1 TaxID=3318354 RepID=UPI003A842839